jgi:hypothetical protein
MTVITRSGVGLALAVMAGAAFAPDSHQSHIPVPLPTDVDPAQLFRDRIQQARIPIELADLAKRLAANGVNDDAEQIRNILQTNPQLQDMIVNDEKGGQFRDLFNQLKQSGQLPLGLKPELIQRKLRALAQTQTARIAPELSSAQPFVDWPPIDKAEQARKRELAAQVAEWADRFPRDHLPEPLRNSPAMQSLLHRLSDSAVDALSGAGGADGWDAQLARLESRWQVARDWLPKEMPAALRRIKLPDLSRLAPNVNMPQIDLDVPHMPSIRGFTGTGADLRSAANVMLGVIGVAVLVAVIWRLSGGRWSSTVGGRRPLGPWPLDPARVASRNELIQAFEYLTLLRCGEPARTWHHHAIAECLGGSETERRTAADQLAALYEQARYAPAAGGEPDWSAARGPLTMLAGAG